MNNKNGCNLSNTDSYIRFFLASVILVIGVTINCYLLALASVILYYTAFTKHCFVYSMLNLNKMFSLKNHYIVHLPKYNQSSVYIFDTNGKILYQNPASVKEFNFVNKLQDFNISNIDELIKNNTTKNIIYEYDEKTYQINLQAKKHDGVILTYLNDVTKIIELNDEIEKTQREVIYTMGEIGETRSKETGNHVKRVALYSEKLALLYGLSHTEAELLKTASPMHDIGKVGIPDAILNAPRKLSVDEFEVMKTHAQLGYDMLNKSNKPILKAAAIVAREHHEKFDGNGYPKGLIGENIHIYGRITAVADVFDALGSERVYKKAWGLDKILDYFEEEKGKHFDPELIKLFQDNLDEFLSIRDRFKD